MHSTLPILELTGIFFLTFVQEDSATLTSAILAYQGVFPYWETLTACLLGMWTSDFLVYLIARLAGLKFFEALIAQKIFKPEQIKRASSWFTRFGWPTLVFSRLVPGSRTALLFASGLLRYDCMKFLAVSFCGALAWLSLVFTLFATFGYSATVFIGSRWVISLLVLTSGATFTALWASRRVSPGWRAWLANTFKSTRPEVEKAD